MTRLRTGALARRALLSLEPLAAAAFGAAPALALARSWRRGGIAVLCYHRVGPLAEWDDTSTTIEPERFREHVRLFADRCEPVGLDALLDPSGGESGKPRVLVTFDDGYRDLLDHALPVLADHGVPSLVFICSQTLEGRALWWDRLLAAVRAAPGGAHALEGPEGETVSVELGDQGSRVRAFRRLFAAISAAPEPLAATERALAGLPPAGVPAGLYLGAQEIAGLVELGAEAGSHGRTHARLTALGDEALRAELEESREGIAAASGRAVRAIAYPFGNAASVDGRVTAAAAAAGYEAGFTGLAALARAGESAFAVPRVPVTGSEGTRRLSGKALGAHPALYDRLARGPGGRRAAARIEPA